MSYTRRDVQRNSGPPPQHPSPGPLLSGPSVIGAPITSPPVTRAPIAILLVSGPPCEATLLGPHRCAFVAEPLITKSSKNFHYKVPSFNHGKEKFLFMKVKNPIVYRAEKNSLKEAKA